MPLSSINSSALNAPVSLRESASHAAEPHLYDLQVPQDARAQLAKGWFALGLFALLASGLFSILLVLSRTPQLQTWFPVADFFRVALVVHVDLSVLVWFLAFGGAVWTMSGTSKWTTLGWLAFGLACLGTVCMILAPFLAKATPVMSNYVPVLDGSFFLTGLFIFGLGITLLCLRSMLSTAPMGRKLVGEGALRFGLNGAMVSTAVAAMAFVWSGLTLPRDLDPRVYYELLFWGGGHVLQFTFTLLMLVSWIWLTQAVGGELTISPRILALLFVVALASVFLTPITYLAYPVTSVEHHRMQTLLMRFGGGIVIPPVAIAVLWALRSIRALVPELRPLRASLLASLALFSAGGIIGFLITGSNVRIPAHYHGCIVGITLAMMGVVYLLLPRWGYQAPTSRAAALQPYVYGAGQLMHIIGLVWSGGYGVQRKVAGSEQVLRSTEEVLGMGLMGLGGLIAIVGGVMFVVIVLRALRLPRGGRVHAG